MKTKLSLITLFACAAAGTPLFADRENYDGQDLSGKSFSDRSMRYSSWIGSTLTGANLSYAKLTGADFTDAVIHGNEEIEGASFAYSGLTLSQLESTASYKQKNLTRVRLSGCDLSGGNFSDFALSGAYFWEATLTNANLSGADLSGANLSSATLTNANLLGADLSGANLSYTTLTNANFTGADIAGASFTRAVIHGNAEIEGASFTSSGLTLSQLESTASYKQKNLTRVGLNGLDLRGWNFSDFILSGADFTDAVIHGNEEISGANFASSGLTLSQLESTASFKQKNLTRADLTGLNLRGWNFSGVFLAGANFAEASLTGANFTDAVIHGNEKIEGANFYSSGVTLSQLRSTASFKQKNLTRVKLSGYDFREGNFSGFILSGAYLASAMLTNADLSGADLSGTDLSSATLTNANLSGADLSGTDLSSATLTNANFTGADIAGASFTRAVIHGNEETAGANFAFSGLSLSQLESTASYKQKNLKRVGLNGLDLRGWNFSDFILSGADFTDAVIHGNEEIEGASFYSNSSYRLTLSQLESTASFKQKNLTRVNLRGCDLRGGNFSGFMLSGASLSSARLTDANLSGADLSGASFYNATLENADFTDAVIHGNAEIEGASFYYSGLTLSQLESTASFKQKNLTRVNLRRYNLRGRNFSDFALSGAYFGEATLTNANLSGADLSGASLSSATLTDANFTGADIAGASFTGAVIHGNEETAGANFALSGLTLSQLKSTESFRQKNLTRVGLSGLDLRGWYFSDFILSGADFTDAVIHGNEEIEGASFYSSGLTLSQLESTASFKQKNLTRVNLRYLDLSGGNFSSFILSGADLSSATLANADFTDAVIHGNEEIKGARFYSSGLTLSQLESTASYKQKNLTRVGLSTLDLSGGNFSSFILSGADLSSATLTNANLSGADLSDANLSYTKLTGADFTGVDLSSVTLTGANFTGTNLTNVNLTGANLSSFALTNVNLSGANLSGADLSSATLTGANFTDAVIHGNEETAGANFDSSKLSLSQLESTASFKQKNLTRVGLRYLDLSGGNFSGFILSDANLSYATLTDADFSGANLTGAYFTGATLKDANFTDAVIHGNEETSGADFASSGLTLSQLESTESFKQKNLTRVDLRGCDLSGGNFSGFILSRANLSSATLTDADFTGVNLTGVDLSSSTLTNANLLGADLSGADFKGAVIHGNEETAGANFASSGLSLSQLESTASFKQKNLKRVGLSGCDLRGGNFSGFMLSGADLSSATLTGAHFSSATLTDADFTDAVIHGNAEIEGASFASSGLTLSQLESTASFKQKNLTRVNLRGYNLRGGNFSDFALSGADFWKATLTNANLSGADLSGANLSYTTLTNANLSGADLSGASFYNATLENADFTDAVIHRNAKIEGASFASSGLTLSQLESTASFKQKNLTRVDLRELDLSGGNFSDFALSSANLRYATLTNANLSGADLSGAYFWDTTLTNANFTGADIAGASFTGAVIHGNEETAGANFAFSGLSLSQLESTESFGQKNLTRVGLSTLDLSGGNFSSFILSGADLSSATLTNANFKSAVIHGNEKISGANFASSGLSLSQLRSTESFGQKNLTRVGLSTLDLSGGNFSSFILSGADLSSATLTNANFTGADIARASFTRAVIHGNEETAGANFDFSELSLSQLRSTESFGQKNLTRVGLSKLDLSGGNFSSFILSGADLSSATLANADFTDAVIHRNAKTAGADFHSSGFYRLSLSQLQSTASYNLKNLTRVNLRELDLRGGDFRNFELGGADFSGATLTNADFRGAQGGFELDSILGSNIIFADGKISNFDVPSTDETLRIRGHEISAKLVDSQTVSGTIILERGATLDVCAGATMALDGGEIHFETDGSEGSLVSVKKSGNVKISNNARLVVDFTGAFSETLTIPMLAWEAGATVSGLDLMIKGGSLDLLVNAHISLMVNGVTYDESQWDFSTANNALTLTVQASEATKPMTIGATDQKVVLAGADVSATFAATLSGFTGSVSGAGTLRSAGTLSFAGDASAHTGTTSVDGGTFTVAPEAKLGTGAFAVASAGTLRIAGTRDFENAISGAGKLATAGDVTMNGDMSGFKGALVAESGTLSVAEGKKLTLSGTLEAENGATLKLGAGASVSVSATGGVKISPTARLLVEYSGWFSETTSFDALSWANGADVSSLSSLTKGKNLLLLVNGNVYDTDLWDFSTAGNVLKVFGVPAAPEPPQNQTIENGDASVNVGSGMSATFDPTLGEFTGTLSGAGEVYSSDNLVFGGNAGALTGTTHIDGGTFMVSVDATLGTGAFEVAGKLSLNGGRTFGNATSGDGTLEIASGETTFTRDMGTKTLSVKNGATATFGAGVSLTHADATADVAGTLKLAGTRTFVAATRGNGAIELSSGSDVKFTKSVGVKTLNVNAGATLNGGVSLTHGADAVLNLEGTLALNADAGEKVSLGGGKVVLASSANLDLGGTTTRRIAADESALESGARVTIFENGSVEGDARAFLATDPTLSALAASNVVLFDASNGLTVQALTNPEALSGGVNTSGLSASFVDWALGGLADELASLSAGFTNASTLGALGGNDPLLNALLSGESGTARAILDRLSPKSYAAMIAMPVETFHDDVRNVAARLEQRRHDSFYQKSHWEFFAQAQTTSAENDTATDAPTFDFDRSGVFAGADVRLDKTTTLGVALGAGTGKAKIRNGGGKIESDDYRLIVFGGKTLANLFYVNAGAQLGFASYDVKRTTDYGGASASADGWNAGVFAETGARLTLSEANELYATPYVGLAYTHASTDSFTESGNERAAFDADSLSGDSLRARIGCAFSWSFDVAGTEARLGLDVAYSRELLDDEIDVNVTAKNGTRISEKAKTAPTDMFSIGPTLDVALTNRMNVYAGYMFRTGTDSSTTHSANVGFRMRF